MSRMNRGGEEIELQLLHMVKRERKKKVFGLYTSEVFGIWSNLFVVCVAMGAIDTMAFISNGVSLVIYFSGYMNFNITKSATTVTNFMGTAFLVTLFGAFLSDTYLSRFKTCVLFGCFEVMVCTKSLNW